MSKLRFFYSKVKLHWGFTVRAKGATAAQPAMILPPPTSVVGAFAYPLARLLGLPEGQITAKKGRERAVITPLFECFIKSAKGASAGLDPGSRTGLSTYMEVTRIIGLVYKTGGQVSEALKAPIQEAIPLIMPVQPVGSTYGPNSILHMAALIDVEELAKCLGVSVGDVDNYGLKSCYGVSRLGSKEGLVSVLEADYGEPEYADGDINTIGYVPASLASKKVPELFTSIYLYDLDYRLTEYIVLGGRLSSQTLITPPPRLTGTTLTLTSGSKAFYLKAHDDLKVVSVVK
jgi:CRISPR-associated protein Cas5a/b/c